VSHNWVHDNANVGLWWDNNNVGFLIEGNYIADNFGHGIEYETSYNFKIVNNTLKRNALGLGKQFQARNDPFPVGAIYISEAGGDARLNGGVYATSEIIGNVFEDNWAGVVMWENADRFGHDDSANTSKGYTTLLVDPSGAKPSSRMSLCADGSIQSAPYTQDCRWKTQNVHVTNNLFKLDKAAVGCVTDLCGQQAIFSNFGIMPSWSPYKGTVIQNSITHRQNNVFRSNQYVGPWRFVGFQATGPTMGLTQWQAAPFNQDLGSTAS
jgi:hypothetical protein